PMAVGGKQHWTDEQAKQYQMAAGNLHRLTFEVENAKQVTKQTPNAQKQFADSKLVDAAANKTQLDPAAATPDRVATEYAKAKQEYDRQREALENARGYGAGTALAMRWLGAILFFAGVFGSLRFGRERTT
ncbi:MAG TPA: hypothetical protein VGI75_03950, partial [Pirellulales bacterium]